MPDVLPLTLREGLLKEKFSKLWSFHLIFNCYVSRFFTFFIVKNAQIKKNVYLLCADRIGKEKDTTFIGVSCAVKLCPNLEIIKFFGKTDEGCLLVNLDI